jgi:hypothetical protein
VDNLQQPIAGVAAVVLYGRQAVQQVRVPASCAPA